MDINQIKRECKNFINSILIFGELIDYRGKNNRIMIDYYNRNDHSSFVAKLLNKEDLALLQVRSFNYKQTRKAILFMQSSIKVAIFILLRSELSVTHVYSLSLGNFGWLKILLERHGIERHEYIHGLVNWHLAKSNRYYSNLTYLYSYEKVEIDIGFTGTLVVDKEVMDYVIGRSRIAKEHKGITREYDNFWIDGEVFEDASNVIIDRFIATNNLEVLLHPSKLNGRSMLGEINFPKNSVFYGYFSTGLIKMQKLGFCAVQVIVQGDTMQPRINNLDYIVIK